MRILACKKCGHTELPHLSPDRPLCEYKIFDSFPLQLGEPIEKPHKYDPMDLKSGVMANDEDVGQFR